MPFNDVRIANASIGKANLGVEKLCSSLYESIAEAACLINRAILLIGNAAFTVEIRIDPIPPFFGMLSLML